MTITIPPKIFPSSIPSDQFAGHGSVPSPTALRRVAHMYNQVSTRRRRTIFTATHNPAKTPSVPSTAQSEKHFNFRTGENVRAVAMIIGMAPASQANGSLPAGVALTIDTATATITSEYTRYARVQAGAYTPADVNWTWAEITVADGLEPNTQYGGALIQTNYARIHSVMIYETADVIANSDIDGVADPARWESDKPIYDKGVQELAEAGTLLWQHNATQLLSWSRHSEATALSGAVTSTSYVNFLGVASTTVTAASPGIRINTQYHDTQSGDVPVEFGVRVRRTAGTGDLDIKLEQAGGTLLSTTISGSATSPYDSSEHTIVASTAEKTDIHVRVSDGSTTYEIDAIGLWEYEAQAPFVWSGTFDTMASDSSDLYKYLGIDGSVSPALGDYSHVWQAEAVPTVDVGTLADGTPYDYATSSDDPSVTTDADFGGGTRDVLEYTSATQSLEKTGTAAIPNPSDGTESFIWGGIMRWDALPGTETYYNVKTRYNATGTKGCLLFVARTGGDALKLRFQFIRGPGATITDVTAVVDVPLGDAMAYLVNVDFQAGKLKLMTSVPGSYIETSLLGTGTFESAKIGYLGASDTAGFTRTFTGIHAQHFSFEYSGTLDAELSEDNMTNFLKYSDGVLT